MSDSFETLWTITCQVPLSMGFSKQEYWSGWPFLPPGDLSRPGIKLGGFFSTGATWEALSNRGPWFHLGPLGLTSTYCLDGVREGLQEQCLGSEAPSPPSSAGP